MKVIVHQPKPRNPFVAASLRRPAGLHQKSTGGRRQQAKTVLRHECLGLDHRHLTTS